MRNGGNWATAILFAASFAGAQTVSEAPVEKVSNSQFGGVVRLHERALKMAEGWSKKAVLYSILGATPRNDFRSAPEDWQFHFGDPEGKDGVFLVVFKDGVLSARQGNRGGVQVVEYFHNGEFNGRRTLREKRGNRDYKFCAPIVEPFVDGPVLERVVRELKLIGDDRDQFRISLLKSIDSRCDGLGLKNLFVFEKPIPKKLLNKPLWIITSKTMTLYVDATTGVPVRKRTRKPPKEIPVVIDPESGLPTEPAEAPLLR